MSTPVQLALFDTQPNGTRIGTLEISDLTQIRSINYGQEGDPSNSGHTVEIQIQGSVRSFIVAAMGITNAQFIQDWCDAVAQGGQGQIQANPIGPAGGDLSGNYPNPDVISFLGQPFGGNTPTLNEVLTWDGSNWNPQVPLSGPPTGAASGDLSGTYPAPSVVALQGVPVSASAPASSQVLTYNGLQWVAAPAPGLGSAGGDLTGTYPNPTVESIQGTAVSPAVPVATNVLTFSGAQWQPAAIPPQPPSGAAGGDLSGTYPNPTVGALQGTAVSATAPANGEVLVYNGSDWQPATTPASPPNGAAAGDLSGTYPNPTVDGLQTRPVAATAPALNEVLAWNGVAWEPAAGGGPPSGAAGGDLNGVYPNPTVDGLQGNPVAATAPSSNDILAWNGVAWEPVAPTANSLQAAYDGGNLIQTDATGAPVVVSQTASANPTPMLVVTKSPTASAGGNAVQISMGGNATGTGVDINNQGSGSGLVVRDSSGPDTYLDITGTGDIIATADTTMTLAATDAAGVINMYTTGIAAADHALQITSGGVVTVNPQANSNNDFVVRGSNVDPIFEVDVNGPSVTVGQDGFIATTTNAHGALFVGRSANFDGNNQLGLWRYDVLADPISIAGLGRVTVRLSPQSGDDELYYYHAGSPVQLTWLSTRGMQAAYHLDNTVGVDSATGSPTYTSNDATAALVLDADSTGQALVVQDAGTDVFSVENTGEVRITQDSVLEFEERAADPGALANYGRLYTKDAAGTTELYYQDSGGGVFQVTNGAAGGDLSGTYPDPTVSGLQTRPVAATAPGLNEVLAWNGVAWEPASGGGPPSGAAGGDLNGTYPNPTVDGLQGRPVAATAPASTNVLAWNGSAWVPTAAGGPPSGSAGGDLNGTYPNPTVDGLQGNPVAATAPANGQVLTFTAGSWTPATPAAVGVSDLQGAYDGGQTIETAASGAVTIQHTGSTATHDLLSLNKSPSGSATGNALTISMNLFADGDAINVTHQDGPGHALVVNRAGTGGDIARFEDNGTPIFRARETGSVELTPRINQDLIGLAIDTGQIRLTGGNTGGTTLTQSVNNTAGGALLVLEAGDSDDGSTGSAGGAVIINAGSQTDAAGGAGGSVNINGGIASGTSTLASRGGDVNIAAGGNTNAVGASGGDIRLLAGFATNPTQAGGSIVLRAGNGATTTDPDDQGSITIGDILTNSISIGGNSFSTGATPGSVSVTGHSTAVASVEGGDVLIDGGNSSGTGLLAFGGSVRITGGDSTSSFGGSAFIQGGESTNFDGGSAAVVGGNTNSAGQTGGPVVIASGTRTGFEDDPQYANNINIGEAQSGEITIGGSTFSVGGKPEDVNILGHEQNVVSGLAGDVRIEGGFSFGTSATGGSVFVDGGQVTGANSSPGNVHINGGQDPGGFDGTVLILDAHGPELQIGSGSNPRPLVSIEDGRLRFVNNTTGTGSSNPGNTGATASTTPNTLYAKNVVKGWVRASGTTVGSVQAAFGLSTSTIGPTAAIVSNGVSSATVTWQHAASSASGNCYGTSTFGQSTGFARFMSMGNHAANACRVYLWTTTTTQAAPSSNIWGLIRMAQQA